MQLQGWSAGAAGDLIAAHAGGCAQGRAGSCAAVAARALMMEHKSGEWYEHSVLVTHWAERELLAVAQMYRDWAGTENLFDGLKNQWGWTGFSTQALKRSQLMARMVSLIYN